jgi:raffinose/stachyose/melibiose transport system substrate-binding protein
MKIKKLGIGVVAALLLTGMAACGTPTDNGGGDASSDKGQVYFLNFKPEVEDQYQAIAKKYTDETGIPVKVVTAASGTYDQMLQSEMAKSDAPTLFQVNGPIGMDEWKDYMADLTDSPIYTQLSNPDFALKNTDGKPVAVPYVIESYGIIYNKTILDKYFADPAAKVKAIPTNWDELKTLADDLQARKADFGLDGAFTSAGFDSSSNWRYTTHMANLPLTYEFTEDNVTSQPATIKGTYLDDMKNIFDLYITDSTTEPSLLGGKTATDAVSEFATGKAALYQNGTWAWTDLQKAGMDPSTVGMMPIYMGIPGEDQEGLATGSENYWCINSKASAADQKATNDFLNWMISSDEGVTAMTKDMGFRTPFKSMAGVTSDNPFVSQALAEQAKGTKDPTWIGMNDMPSQTWKDNLGNALLAYAQGGSWDDVKTAFVDGWASEYTLAHSND